MQGIILRTGKTAVNKMGFFFSSLSFPLSKKSKENACNGEENIRQRPTEFYQENTPVIADTLFQQYKRQFYT